MRNFFTKLQNALFRFMYGRNGTDQLNVAITVVYLVVFVLGSVLVSLTRSQLLSSAVNAVTVILVVILFWRTFSKKLHKRREENARFIRWWTPKKAALAGAKLRLQDKQHKYFTCKNCKTVCRVPSGKGKIEITCPKCGRKIVGKS